MTDEQLAAIEERATAPTAAPWSSPEVMFRVDVVTLIAEVRALRERLHETALALHNALVKP